MQTSKTSKISRFINFLFRNNTIEFPPDTYFSFKPCELCEEEQRGERWPVAIIDDDIYECDVCESCLDWLMKNL